MKTTILWTHFTYRVHATDDINTYVATCQIHKYGDVGLVYAMLGKKLLSHLIRDLLAGKLKEVGINSLEGYVLDDVVKYIKAIEKFTKNGKATFGKTCVDNGMNLTWVTVSRVEN
jgi:hypothetical protein